MRYGSYAALESENERLRERIQSKDDVIAELNERIDALLADNEEYSNRITRLEDMINYLNEKHGTS